MALDLLPTFRECIACRWISAELVKVGDRPYCAQCLAKELLRQKETVRHLTACLQRHDKEREERLAATQLTGRFPAASTMNDSMWDSRLCFVDPHHVGWAWFTTGRLEDVTGDDWDDAPYESNCSQPYSGTQGTHFVKVAFDGDWVEPKDGYWNSPYSVDAINAGAVAWLRHDANDGKIVCIPAGTPLADFVSLIRVGGGQVYLPYFVEGDS